MTDMLLRFRGAALIGLLCLLILAPGGRAAPRRGATEIQSPEVCGRLQVKGRFITCASGEPFRWRGVTGFRLVHQVARDEEASARRYLSWARDAGFNLIRVVSTATFLFDLSPEDGRAALPRALVLAREFGLYVEVIAVNDSADRDYDWRLHSRLVAETCAAVDHCIFEFANEPGHGLQDVRLHDMDSVDRFASAAVDGLDVVWTAGPSWGDDMADSPSGAFVVRHLERAGTPWDMAQRLWGFERLSARLDRPVVSNEPIGFDEQPGAMTGRQRIVDCDAALVFGALSRVLEVGTTFHLQAGLQNEGPGALQRLCATDFIRGTRLVPDAVVLNARQVGDPLSPIESVVAGNAERVYAGTGSGRGLVVTFGAGGLPDLAWRPNVEAVLAIDRPEVRIWRVQLGDRTLGGSLWESNPPLPSWTGGDRF